MGERADLLESYLDGRLAPEEERSLEARLQAEPALAEELVSLVRDEVLLSEWAESQTALGAGRPVVRRSSRVRRRAPLAAGSLGVGVAVAAGILLVLGLLFFSGTVRRQPGKRHAAVTPTVPHEQLSGTEQRQPVPVRSAERAEPRRVPQPTVPPQTSSHTEAPVPGETPPKTARPIPQPPASAALPFPVQPVPSVEALQQDAPRSDPQPPSRVRTERPLARLARIEGRVMYARGASGPWVRAIEGIRLLAGDRLDTRTGMARLDFEQDKDARIYLNRSTVLRVLRAEIDTQGPVTLVDLSGGEVYVEDGSQKIHVETPDGLFSPVGTRFDVERRLSSTVVTVEEGRVEAASKPLGWRRETSRLVLRPREWGTAPVPVGAGQKSRVRRGAAPTAPKRADVARTVSWAEPLGLQSRSVVLGRIARHLVAHWGFDEMRVGTAADSSRHGHAGRHVKFPPGYGPHRDTAPRGERRGRSLHFDGRTSRVDIAHAAELNLTSGFTVALWYKAENNAGSVIGKPYKKRVCVSWQIGFRAGKLSFTSSDRNGQWDDKVPAPPAGTWVHAAATWDGTVKKLFVNGEEKLSVRRAIAFDPHGLVVGGIYDGTKFVQPFKGWVDDLRIYDRALTAPEIEALYGRQANRPSKP